MMKICVLQADYGSSKVDYQYFDPKRDLSGLIPDAHFEHVFLNKLTCYRQLKELSFQQYDIFVNLCEGYLEWDIPSIDVIYSLELLDLPFTGPTTKLYDPPKDLMKYVAYCEGIKTPAYLKINRQADIQKIVDTLRFPMFVKPLKAGDSLGIDDHSKVNDVNALKNKINNNYYKWLTFDYNVFYSINKRGNINKTNTLKSNLKILLYPVSNQTFGIYRDDYSYQFNNQNFRNQFIDLSYQYTIEKSKIDIELRWTNILNTKTYEELLLNDLGYTSNSIVIRPSQIFASVKFNFN